VVGGSHHATCLRDIAFRNKISVTSKGYIGWAPIWSQSGNELCILLGEDLPSVVRLSIKKTPRLNQNLSSRTAFFLTFVFTTRLSSRSR